jgi:hypothetical protein
MGIDLPLIWAIIIIFGIMMYVVMDGFDLGIGILFPFIKGEKDRDVMMNTVAPYGTVTKPGWYWAVPRCLAPSRWPTRWCCRRCTCR